MTTDSSKVASDLQYLHGFGNEHEKPLPGALPIGRFSPQRVSRGLYAEQFNSTAFTAPRAHNRRSWFYRIRPLRYRRLPGLAAGQGAHRADHRGAHAAKPVALGSVVATDRAH